MQEALMLLGVGIGTVFLVLLLIIWLSSGLIAVINRWFPEKEAAKVIRTTAAVPARTIAAITAAVNAATGGRAKVTGIEKVSPGTRKDR